MRYKSFRQLRRNGQSLYVIVPQLARHLLKVWPNDWVEVELDMDRRELVIRPRQYRDEAPVFKAKRPDMSVIVEKLETIKPAAPALYPSTISRTSPA
jgi:antitoxin component of MazEF toxin-antitoxin module